MRDFSIFFYEWRHLVRSPFKLVAFVLFAVASVYGLHNGASLYKEQHAEIQRIRAKADMDRQTYLAYYDEGKVGPEERPWIDITTPFWAIWYNGVYHFKTPSPALVYCIGQAEQYGFYKRVTFWASAYDSDMTQEIANPERLQFGTLDFSFSLLYLMPLLLLILLYNLKSTEAEQGFLPLIEVQTTSTQMWLFMRFAFYVAIFWLLFIALLMYGTTLTPVFDNAPGAFGQMVLYGSLYTLFWSVLFYLVVAYGNSIMGNTLQMVGLWLIVAFLIPGLVHQWVGIEKPADLMVEFIDAGRDKQNKLFEQPDSVLLAKLDSLFPEIRNSPVARDSAKRIVGMNTSGAALANALKKSSIAIMEKENDQKNKLIESTFPFNPVAYFQNRLNRVSDTHYEDYKEYRNQIQALIDLQIKTMVLDTWNEVEIDKEHYLTYQTRLTTL